MAEHHDQVRARMVQRIIQTGRHVQVDHVAGDAHHKEIAKALIKKQLGWNPGIRASQDDGLGVLSVTEMISPALALMMESSRALHKTQVALAQLKPGLSGGCGRLGLNPGGQGQQKKPETLHGCLLCASASRSQRRASSALTVSNCSCSG